MTPWTVNHQAPLFMGFPDKNTRIGGFPGKNSRIGCHFLPRRSSDPGIKPVSLELVGSFFTTEPLGKTQALSIVPGIEQCNQQVNCITLIFIK